MKRHLLSFFLVLFISLGSFHDAKAQEKETMRDYARELTKLFSTAFTAPTDNERFNANEQALAVLLEALQTNQSFDYTWPELKGLSILTAKDKKFKIFTWAIIRDNGEYECFGYIQVLNPKTEKYDAYALTDLSTEIFGAEDALLSNTNWYGAIYYQLIETQFKDKVYYTLLGWTGNDLVKQRKVIEPISFKGNSTQPIFGQSIFLKDKARKRVIFEYTKEANMLLRYDLQYFSYKERVTSKNAPAKFEDKREQKEMIIFDVIEPMNPGMEGLYQYYAPSGNEAGYTFENGRWRFLENVISTSHEKNPKDIYQKEDSKPRVDRPRYYQP